MKSGKKIYRRMLLVSDREGAVSRELRALGNGALRSLILHMTHQPDASESGEQILAQAMCEVTRRFIDKGKKVL